MTFDNPVGINDPSGEYTYDAATFRRFVSAQLTHDGNALSARPGVLHGLSLSVSSLTVTLNPGAAVVTPVAGANGSYVATGSDAESVTVSPPDASFGRIDALGLAVLDPEVSGSVRGAELVVAEGTPSASPQAPSLPAGVVPLSRVTVPVSGALTVTDTRQFTASAGGVVPCTSSTRPEGSSLRPGQFIFEQNTGRVQVWTGSAWRLVSVGPVTQAGRATVTPGSPLAISFPSEFPGTPVVTATAESPSSAVENVTVNSVTSTGCTLNLFRTNTPATGVMWIAVWLP